MKRVLFFAFYSCTTMLFGQQIALNSQYMFNPISFNPGAAGSNDYVSIHANVRQQWLGFEGAPSSQTISSHGYLGKNMGIGGSFYNEVTGPSRRTGFQAMGAYRLKLSSDRAHMLGMGLSLSMTQHIIDESRLTTYLPDDPAILKGFNNKMVPDANIGFYYTFKDKGFAGISARNLLQTDVNLFDYEVRIVNPMVRNYYVYGGYNFSLPKKWTLTPTGMFRMIDALAMSFDVSVLANYNNTVWFGGSYRYQDAAVAMAGLQFGQFKFGYSYDFTLSDIKNYSSGSHELFLELQVFGKDKSGSSSSKIPWLKRNRIYSPSL
jgi:type IX secretion system PorP/SprF family membrane protein